MIRKNMRESLKKKREALAMFEARCDANRVSKSMRLLVRNAIEAGFAEHNKPPIKMPSINVLVPHLRLASEEYKRGAEQMYLAVCQRFDI